MLENLKSTSVSTFCHFNSTKPSTGELLLSYLSKWLRVLQWNCGGLASAAVECTDTGTADRMNIVWQAEKIPNYGSKFPDKEFEADKTIPRENLLAEKHTNECVKFASIRSTGLIAEDWIDCQIPRSQNSHLCPSLTCTTELFRVPFWNRLD